MISIIKKAKGVPVVTALSKILWTTSAVDGREPVLVADPGESYNDHTL